jgi:hypothetical protein
VLVGDGGKRGVYRFWTQMPLNVYLSLSAFPPLVSLSMCAIFCWRCNRESSRFRLFSFCAILDIDDEVCATRASSTSERCGELAFVCSSSFERAWAKLPGLVGSTSLAFMFSLTVFFITLSNEMVEDAGSVPRISSPRLSSTMVTMPSSLKRWDCSPFTLFFLALMVMSLAFDRMSGRTKLDLLTRDMANCARSWELKSQQTHDFERKSGQLHHY